MPKIVSVFLDRLHGDGQTDVSLEVHLSNGQILMISLNLVKADDPCFAKIISGVSRDAPKTDGERVFWQDGTSLSIEEIMEMVEGGSI